MKVLIDIGGYDTEEVTVECINLEFLMQHFHVVAYGDFVAPFAPMITIGELMETIEPDKALAIEAQRLFEEGCKAAVELLNKKK